MERYHNPENDPLPMHSPVLELERRRIASLTKTYLDKGGRINEVGYKMRDQSLEFVINAQRSPVYAHLFTAPTTLQ